MHQKAINIKALLITLSALTFNLEANLDNQQKKC